MAVVTIFYMFRTWIAIFWGENKGSQKEAEIPAAVNLGGLQQLLGDAVDKKRAANDNIVYAKRNRNNHYRTH